ncbi:MAG: succinylglutamate desuccinylase/aspartoacylase family protein [Hyphomicrobiales bacterium]
MPTYDFIPLPTQTPGTVRHLRVCRYGERGARPKAYVQAGIHADELPANLTAHRLTQKLAELDGEGRIAGEIVVVPVANPVGLAQIVLNDHQGRYHAGTGGNFNRAWPDVSRAVMARTAGSLGSDIVANTELVRQLLREELERLKPQGEFDTLRVSLMRLACDADYVLDLHTDAEAELHIYLDQDDWPASEDLASLLGCRVIIFARDTGDSPFDETVRRAYLESALGGVPVKVPLSATVELRGEGDTSDALADRDADALIAFLARRGLLAGPRPDAPAFDGVAGPYTATDIVKAPAAGIIVFRRAVGDWIEAGDVIAEIVDPYSLGTDCRTPVKASANGRLYARTSERLAWPGRQIAKVHGDTPLAHRTGTLLYD